MKLLNFIRISQGPDVVAIYSQNGYAIAYLTTLPCAM